MELFDYVRQRTPFDLLVPVRQTQALRKHYRALPQEAFVRHWAGFAIATEHFTPRRTTLAEPCDRYIQRSGERPEEYYFKGFCCTRARPEVPALTRAFPDRWHIEEFFRFDQHLGWKRAGTLNLHIRLGQMSLALLAQAVIHQLRQALGRTLQPMGCGPFRAGPLQRLGRRRARGPRHDPGHLLQRPQGGAVETSL